MDEANGWKAEWHARYPGMVRLSYNGEVSQDLNEEKVAAIRSLVLADVRKLLAEWESMDNAPDLWAFLREAIEEAP